MMNAMITIDCLMCPPDILSGSVGFFNNYNLCHIRTVNWDEILTGSKAKTIYVYNFTQPERECMPFDRLFASDYHLI